FAPMHQHLIDRQPMEPGGEGRLAAEASDLAKEQNEDFLSQVFSFSDVPRHPQAERIHAPVVAPVKLFEGLHVASPSPLRQREIGSFNCLVCCAHTFLRQSYLSLPTSVALINGVGR